MTPEELQQRIDGGRETANFEVKGPMEWDKNSLTKDILAMSNVQDGGLILIGVQDDTFRSVGVSDAVRATYREEEMRDQVAVYADPFVEFDVTFPKNPAGQTYVLIDVKPFRELPTICRRDGAEVKAGAIYYRPSSRRPESCTVSTSYDMRNILDVAAARLGRRYERLGLEVTEPNSDFKKALDDELEGL